jgi:hypothetical protein
MITLTKKLCDECVAHVMHAAKLHERFVDARETFEELKERVILVASCLIIVLIDEGSLVVDLILFLLFVQTMMIDVGEVFSELEYLGQARYDSLIVHNLD